MQGFNSRNTKVPEWTYQECTSCSWKSGGGRKDKQLSALSPAELRHTNKFMHQQEWGRKVSCQIHQCLTTLRDEVLKSSPVPQSPPRSGALALHNPHVIGTAGCQVHTRGKKAIQQDILGALWEDGCVRQPSCSQESPAGTQ